MPHRKAVQVTTTTHAFVLAFYGLLTILGVLHLVGEASHMGMDTLFGTTVTTLWALATVLSGLLAMMGAVGSRLLANPSITLWVEALGVMGLGAMSTMYVASLWTSQGPFEVLATQVPQWAVIIGGIARIAQIAVETRRIRLAMTHADTTPVLAQSDD